jgi:hypothetical protein
VHQVPPRSVLSSPPALLARLSCSPRTPCERVEWSKAKAQTDCGERVPSKAKGNFWQNLFDLEFLYWVELSWLSWVDSETCMYITQLNNGDILMIFSKTWE